MAPTSNRRHLSRTRGALIVVFAVTTAISVGGYVSSGHTWGVYQVPIYVNPTNVDGLSESALESAVMAGANAWTSQSNANIQFYYAGRTTGTSLAKNYKNEVFFRNESNGSTAAVTYWWYDGTGHLVDADIVFYDGGFKFFTGTTSCSNGIYVEDVATHEFGHALGLSHTSVSGATMVSSTGWCSQNWRTLEADDIAGIEALYPPGGSTTLPAAPSGLWAEASQSDPSGAIDLGWNDTSTNEDRFLVERTTDGGNWMQVASLGANVAHYTNAGLSAGSVYTYRVRASNVAGFSGYSNSAQGSTDVSVATTPPAVPDNPSPTNGATNVSTDTTLSWGGSPGETYDVYFGTTASPAIYTTGLVTRSLSLKGLSQATKYYWRVVARNSEGAAQGSTWSFTTRATRGKKK